MLDHKIRYLQIAFNYDLPWCAGPALDPPSQRILIEAGTPFIKREGMAASANTACGRATSLPT